MTKEEYYGTPEYPIPEQLDMFDNLMDFSKFEVDVTYEFSDVTFPEISLSEFEENVIAKYDLVGFYTTEYVKQMATDYSRDWVLWEETKPLVDFNEVDALKKDVADLTESLYKAYTRIKELSEEVADLKSQLSQINIHKNTRKF